MPSAEEFRTELKEQIARARAQGRPHVEINAGELHRRLGGYPPRAGATHSMPLCCSVMREEYNNRRDLIIHATDSGQGASLTIRYCLKGSEF